MSTPFGLEIDHVGNFGGFLGVHRSLRYGNVSRNMPDVRVPGNKNFDILSRSGSASRKSTAWISERSYTTPSTMSSLRVRRPILRPPTSDAFV
jgi:hypothetical protein